MNKRSDNAKRSTDRDRDTKKGKRVPLLSTKKSSRTRNGARAAREKSPETSGSEHEIESEDSEEEASGWTADDGDDDEFTAAGLEDYYTAADCKDVADRALEVDGDEDTWMTMDREDAASQNEFCMAAASRDRPDDENPLSDEWYFNSGASRHMITNQIWNTSRGHSHMAIFEAFLAYALQHSHLHSRPSNVQWRMKIKSPTPVPPGLAI